MRPFRRMVLVVALLPFAPSRGAGTADYPIPDGARVLWIGNSLIGSKDGGAAGYTDAALAAFGGPDMNWHVVGNWGESLAWGLLACTNWPIPSDGLPAPVAAAGADPVLVVGTTGDPATPYEWSVALTEQLDSGVLLTYEGSPHTAYRKGSACVDGIVNAYLIEGKVPANGTRCD